MFFSLPFFRGQFIFAVVIVSIPLFLLLVYARTRIFLVLHIYSCLGLWNQLLLVDVFLCCCNVRTEKRRILHRRQIMGLKEQLFHAFCDNSNLIWIQAVSYSSLNVMHSRVNYTYRYRCTPHRSSNSNNGSSGHHILKSIRKYLKAQRIEWRNFTNIIILSDWPEWNFNSPS